MHQGCSRHASAPSSDGASCAGLGSSHTRACVSGVHFKKHVFHDMGLPVSLNASWVGEVTIILPSLRQLKTKPIQVNIKGIFLSIRSLHPIAHLHDIVVTHGIASLRVQLFCSSPHRFVLPASAFPNACRRRDRVQAGRGGGGKLHQEPHVRWSRGTVSVHSRKCTVAIASSSSTVRKNV